MFCQGVCCSRQLLLPWPQERSSCNWRAQLSDWRVATREKSSAKEVKFPFPYSLNFEIQKHNHAKLKATASFLILFHLPVSVGIDKFDVIQNNGLCHY